MSWLNFAMSYLGEPATSVEDHEGSHGQVVSSYVWLPESGSHGIRHVQEWRVHVVEVWCPSIRLRLTVNREPTHPEIITMLKLAWNL